MMVLKAANPWFLQQQEEEQRRPTTPTGLYVVMGEEMLLEEDLNHHHHSQNLLYNLNMLKEKLHQVETLLLNNNLAPLSPGQEAAGIAAGIQDIIVTASSMLFYCQQMSLNAAAMIHTTNNNNNNNNNTHDSMQQDGSGFYIGKLEEGTPVGGLLVEDGHANKNDNNGVVVANGGISRSGGGGGSGGVSRSGFLSSASSDYDIIEVGAGDLLAENSHYCHICGKGFKRDANLRMHMRAHGDEYKSNAALTKPPPPPPPPPPSRSSSSSASFEDYNSGQFLINLPRKYSCPEEGCRWNKKHAKFQPLKSMICVKNHYKRSHCPKMYVCNRCSRKKFSVLSDLRTHEKHCGDLKWRCSCGTTFSRKDKLLGHLALFVGHAPATHPIT